MGAAHQALAACGCCSPASLTDNQRICQTALFHPRRRSTSWSGSGWSSCMPLSGQQLSSR